MCERVVYLWNDGEFGPQVVQAYLRYLHPVDGDLSCCSFQQSEEAQRHGGLAGPCTTHDTNLYTYIHRAMISEATLLMHSHLWIASSQPPHLLSSFDAQCELL